MGFEKTSKVKIKMELQHSKLQFHFYLLSLLGKRAVNSFLYFFMVIAIPFYVFSQRQRVCDKCPDHACEQAQAPGIHEQEEHLPAEHPAPGPENVRGRLGGPHGKSHRRRVDQYP